MDLLTFLTIRGLAPHGYCLLWDPRLIALHVVSDAVIGLSYFSIPVVLGVLLARRRDIEFGWLVVLFATFIMACGTTHFMSILTLWVPAYGLEGLVKGITAAASILTAIAMWPLLPRLIAIPSPRQLQLANEDLRREAAERAKVEEELRQVQKMEAVGQLTGGIAHDFNNLLTVIMGNMDRAMRLAADRPERARAALEQAQEAARQAAAVTDQLLTFSRRRPVRVEETDLNAVVRKFATLVDTTIGFSVALDLRLDPAPLPARIDVAQFESTLLNLAINARDAMPQGGRLTIATERLDSGADKGCVAIHVTDTGTGMDADTMARATEPFFTTKPVGQGTGLGLSQVYGFARQAGGHLDIRSAPGEGTTISIVLPCTEGN